MARDYEHHSRENCNEKQRSSSSSGEITQNDSRSYRGRGAKRWANYDTTSLERHTRVTKTQSGQDKEIIGAEPKFAVGESTRIRPDQWRLIGAGLAFPLLILIVVFHEIAISEFWIAAIALPGVTGRIRDVQRSMG